MKRVLKEKKTADSHKHNESQKHFPVKNLKLVKDSPDKYYCTMLCEGDKTYPKPGDCPVCGMHLKKVETVAKTVTKSGTIYTCPMHPEVQRDKPGSCPICGMTLVPVKGVETAEEDKSYRKMLLKFWIGVGLTIPVFIIAMSDIIPFLHLESFASMRARSWIELILTSPVIFYCGWDFF